MNHRFRFSTSVNPTKHKPIGYLSLWVQPRSVTSGDLSLPWNSSGAMSRVTSSHVLTPISSTIPIQVNRTTPSCVYSRFRWNLVEDCSSYDVITLWPDLTQPNFFHQKLRKKCPISYGKFQHDSPNGVASSSEKLMGGCITPWPGEGWHLEVIWKYNSPNKLNEKMRDQRHRRSKHTAVMIHGTANVYHSKVWVIMRNA